MRATAREAGRDRKQQDGHGGQPDPDPQDVLDPVRVCRPIACTRPSIGAFTHVVESRLEYPAGALGSRCAGNADTAAVATAA